MTLERSTDLQTQVADRKRELIGEIIEHKKNCSRYGAAEAIGRIQDRLSDLVDIVKETNGWTSLTPNAKLRLAEWMSR